MDFLGSTTPAELVASVTQGVQDTGTVLWPFLLFVGVPMAFVIGRYLIGFIKSSVGNRKS